MEDKIIKYNNKILNCIIDICESHPPRYNNLKLENMINLEDDYFRKSISKNFSNDEIKNCKGKEQIIYDYSAFVNSDFFYKNLLEDFKLSIYKILQRNKRLVLLLPFNDNDFFESIFNNSISFIYFYNFVMFMKDISSKFPEIVNDKIYKIDLIIILSIFSPYYKITFENGVEDKYGINYESYTILMIELIDLIRKKKYVGYKDILDIEKHEFKFPKTWEIYINKIELDILELLFFKNYIIKRNNDDKFIKLIKANININTNAGEYFLQIKDMYNKFDKNKNLSDEEINKNLNIIINNILQCKLFDVKKEVIKQIIDNKTINEGYKLLNDYNILINLKTLYELYSLDKNEFYLQLIYSFDLVYRLENDSFKTVFNISSFLDYIKNRKKIIQELKTAKDYSKEFKDILGDQKFKNNLKRILKSSVVKNYYKNPKYYSDNNSETLKLIGEKKFIDIYEDFINKYIENDKIYEKIFFKRMPYGIKGAVTTFLCLIIDPFGVDMNNNIKDKTKYLETYLIILFLHETNHYSKRSCFMNMPLSLCKTPKSYEGGDNIIHNIFGKSKIYIINDELCAAVNNISSWEGAKTAEEIKEFRKTLKNIIKKTNIENFDIRKLIKIKSEQNCLISFYNYKEPIKKDSKIIYSVGGGGGYFRF